VLLPITQVLKVIELSRVKILVQIVESRLILTCSGGVCVGGGGGGGEGVGVYYMPSSQQKE